MRNRDKLNIKRAVAGDFQLLQVKIDEAERQIAAYEGRIAMEHRQLIGWHVNRSLLVREQTALMEEARSRVAELRAAGCQSATESVRGA